jgi:ligand-binding sensor domain-containing protein/AraC-like DNA-binding protein
MNIISKKSALVFFLVMFLAPRLAAPLNLENPLNDRLVEEWNSSRGLPSDNVYCLAQTPDGYLWIGTQRGLVRSDGLRHETILHQPVYDLCPGRDGGLWVCLGNELLRYQYSRFIPVRPKGHDCPIPASCAFEDMKGDLWVGHDGGILGRLRNGAYTVFKLPLDKDPGAITAIKEDGRGTLWLGTLTGGLFQGRDGVFSRCDIGRSNDFAVFRIREDRSGNLWAATNIGLVKIQDNGAILLTQRNGLSVNYVLDFLEDSDGNLWCATAWGLNLLHQDVGGAFGATILNQSEQAVGPLFEDREKNLWFAYSRSGLKCYKNALFRTLAGEVGLPDYASTVFASRDGTLWIGDQVGCLYRMKNGRAHQVLDLGYSPEAGIQSLAEDSQGRLWFGTAFRGVFQVKDGRAVPLNVGRSLPCLQALLCDSRGRMWIGCQNGLGCLRDGVFQTLTTADGLPGDRVYSVLEDRSGRIWIATIGGLAVLKNGEWSPGEVETIVTGQAILTLCQDEESVLWAGTFGHGLIRDRNGEKTSFGRREGLGSDIIWQVKDDAAGFLWLSSPEGLIRVSKASLGDEARIKSRGLESLVYGKADGLKGEGASSTVNSMARTPDGELWFALGHGISTVHPEKIKVNRFRLTPVLTRILFNHEEIPLGAGQASFQGVKNIRFEFAAPSFVSPERVKLRYKLEGIDSDWRPVEAFGEKSAEYRDVPFGSYRFRVAACNSDNIWNENDALFDFSLKPYLHQTWPFKAGVMALALVVGLLAFSGLQKFLEQRRLKRKYKNSTLDPGKAEDYLKNLMQLFEEEKIYRAPDLSLASLSARLGITPRDLSRIINERLNRNFWALVNSYRIGEARMMIKDTANGDHTILDIALEVGFNSLAAFNRAFKKFTGMTPSHYKKKNSRAENHARGEKQAVRMGEEKINNGL